jgi:protein-tyrosine-phosphatase
MKVLFVCSGNAHRSPLAEAILKKLRPDLVVNSAGVNVAIPISTKVREYLAGENAEQYLKKAPESLDGRKLQEFDLIIAMQQSHKNAVLSKCPECKDKIVVWNIEDPYFMLDEDAEKVYRRIKEKVTELAQSL